MPAVTPRACNISYLQKYAFADPEKPQVFMLKRINQTYLAIPPLVINFIVSELLELLDKVLKNQNLPPIELDSTSLLVYQSTKAKKFERTIAIYS